MISIAAASRRFLVTFALLLAVVVVLIVLAHGTFYGLSSANRWSLHTYQVLSATHQMQQGIAEMEAGFRGYAITRDPGFREQWTRGLQQLRDREDSIHRLVADNPAQRRRLLQAQQAFAEWLRLHQESGVLQPDLSRETALGVAAEPRAMEARSIAVERARRLLAEMGAAESALLHQRAQRAATLELRTRWLLLTGSFLAVSLAVVTAVMVERRSRRLAEVNRALENEVAEHERARDDLARVSRQNQLILESAAEGITVLDAQGYTVFLNPAAARMLDRRPDDAIGRPFEAVLGMGAAGGAGPNPVRDTLATGAGHEVKDAVFRCAGGSVFPVEYSSASIVEEGRITGAVVSFRDVAERREVERMKDEFISVVSHELRTPLTSIRGSLGLLAAGQLGEVSEKGRRMLEIAVQNTDRLVRLINDILDIERIESGRVTMELRAVDAAELARHSAEVMAGMAEKAGVRLTVRGERQALEADPDRILQVLTNLLSNAIKFSPRGGEVVLATGRGEGEAVFRVSDRGRGIPADRLESIFERFSQVDSSDAREKGGTGLGLAICRSIVQQHGGRIRVESRPGEGSTFTFTLPSAHAAPEPRAVQAQDGDGPLVLLCDDDPSVLVVVEEILREWGYRTVGVRDGRSAVREARRLHPDAILLDMMMPGMTGSDTLRALRQDAETRSIPIVILSALKPIPRVQAAREVVDWVEKPFREEGLIHALEEAVSVRWKPRRVVLVEDDPDLARVLLEVFVRHGIEALHAPTGVEAVELCRRARPDLLVLDLGLPHGDGYWVVEALRGDGAPGGVPTVVYTARELDEEDRERLRLGHTEFLTKGRVSPEEFEKRVVSLLNRIAPARHTTTAR